MLGPEPAGTISKRTMNAMVSREGAPISSIGRHEIATLMGALGEPSYEFRGQHPQRTDAVTRWSVTGAELLRMKAADFPIDELSHMNSWRPECLVRWTGADRIMDFPVLCFAVAGRSGALDTCAAACPAWEYECFQSNTSPMSDIRAFMQNLRSAERKAPLRILVDGVMGAKDDWCSAPRRNDIRIELAEEFDSVDEALEAMDRAEAAVLGHARRHFHLQQGYSISVYARAADDDAWLLVNADVRGLREAALGRLRRTALEVEKLGGGGVEAAPAHPHPQTNTQTPSRSSTLVDALICTLLLVVACIACDVMYARG